MFVFFKKMLSSQKMFVFFKKPSLIPCYIPDAFGGSWRPRDKQGVVPTPEAGRAWLSGNLGPSDKGWGGDASSDGGQGEHRELDPGEWTQSQELEGGEVTSESHLVG